METRIFLSDEAFFEGIAEAIAEKKCLIEDSKFPIGRILVPLIIFVVRFCHFDFSF